VTIDALIRKGATDPDVITLAGGLPASELFPRKNFAAAFLRAMHKPSSNALQYDWPEGQDALRHWVASRLKARNVSVDSSQIIITAGAQQGLALASNILLSHGTQLAVGEESYSAALDLFRRRKAIFVSDESQAQCGYLVDGINNPQGVRPSAAYANALIARGLPVIADEAYAELTFDGRMHEPLLARNRDRVWHVGTLSKTLAPGLRVGWLVPPPSMIERVIDLKQTLDLQTSSLGQAIAQQFLVSDDFDERLVRARAFYYRRASALVSALRRYLPEWSFVEPEGGFSIFVHIDAEKSDEGWLQCALEHGVTFDPGSMFRPEQSHTPLAMRLSYSSTPPKKIVEAVKRLAAAWSAYRKNEHA